MYFDYDNNIFVLTRTGKNFKIILYYLKNNKNFYWIYYHKI